MKPGFLDRVKMGMIRYVRAINHRSIQHWSHYTYRRRPRPGGAAPVAVPAPTFFADATIPPGLFLANVVPYASQLGLAYVLPYYGLAAACFALYRAWPITRGMPWDHEGGRHFPSTDEGWGNLLDDREFGRLRLQGPNPFLLRRSGEGFEVDYGPVFEGVAPAVRCQFRVEGEDLLPVSIDVDGRRVAPGDADWERVKLLANAIDARYTVFVQHLLNSHLRVGQAYALSAWELPDGHPIRPFLDLHTYGTLQVNAYAWALLLGPTSYFILSGFVTREQGIRLFQNALRHDVAAALDAPTDIADRGIAAIPGHPYVADAERIWPVLLGHAERHVNARYATDAAVETDAPLHRWHDKLAALLPGATMPPLRTRADLARRLTWLLYNNVTHEISGDFAIYTAPMDVAQKRIIRWETLHDDQPVDLGDVFLFEQGAWSGMFNTAGNNLLATPLEGYVRDPALLKEMAALRAELREVDAELARRNAARSHRFERMQPRQWELSISF